MSEQLRQPVLSGLQQGAPNALNHYSPVLVTRLHSLIVLHGRFIVHHHDLCLFHQAVYARLLERDHVSTMSRLRQAVREIRDRGEQDERRDVKASQVRESVNAFDMETDGMCRHADQLLVIGLWSLVELYCGRTLIVAEIEQQKDRGSAPHRWHEVLKRFSGIGIDLRQSTGYSGVDRCRVINNKIKHVGIVDTTYVGRWPAPVSLPGGPLEKVALGPQHLANSVFEFVGHTMERTGVLFPLRED